MMGEVVSVLEGKIRVSATHCAPPRVHSMLMPMNFKHKIFRIPPPPQSPTLLDYGEVLLKLLPLEGRTTHLFSYICELSLLFSAFATASPAKVACAALLLTRALHHYGNNTCRTQNKPCLKKDAVLTYNSYTACQTNRIYSLS